jgi:hypothetical protein
MVWSGAGNCKAVAIDYLMGWYEAARKSGAMQIAHGNAGSRWRASMNFL